MEPSSRSCQHPSKRLIAWHSKRHRRTKSRRKYQRSLLAKTEDQLLFVEPCHGPSCSTLWFRGLMLHGMQFAQHTWSSLNHFHQPRPLEHGLLRRWRGWCLHWLHAQHLFWILKNGIISTGTGHQSAYYVWDGFVWRNEQKQPCIVSTCFNTSLPTVFSENVPRLKPKSSPLSSVTVSDPVLTIHTSKLSFVMLIWTLSEIGGTHWAISLTRWQMETHIMESINEHQPQNYLSLWNDTWKHTSSNQSMNIKTKKLSITLKRDMETHIIESIIEHQPKNSLSLSNDTWKIMETHII